MGLSGLASQLGRWNTIAAIDGFNLDGLLALWHPASAN
jgi:hypothetical protein